MFPRGMTGPADDPYAFSFSGLKTAVARYVESHPDALDRRHRGRVPGGRRRRVDHEGSARGTELGVSTLLIAGGVAANSRLRELAAQRCAAAGLTLRIPRPRFCTDNGAMIARSPRTWSPRGPAVAAGRAERPGYAVVHGQRPGHSSKACAVRCRSLKRR